MTHYLLLRITTNDPADTVRDEVVSHLDSVPGYQSEVMQLEALRVSGSEHAKGSQDEMCALRPRQQETKKSAVSSMNRVATLRLRESPTRLSSNNSEESFDGLDHKCHKAKPLATSA